MLIETLPSVMHPEPLAIPHGSPEDVRGAVEPTLPGALCPSPQHWRAPPALTWKYWFSCTRLSLDKILLMVMRLLLIPPKPVGVRGQGTVQL